MPAAGFKATTLSPLQEQVSVVQSIPRSNRSSSTRKPTVVYATSTESSSSSSTAKPSSVVQTIPRGRKTTTTSSTTTTTEAPRPYVHYKTLKSRPRYFINGQQRPSSVSVEEDSTEDSQINRPSTEEKASSYRRILFAKRPVDHNLRPITEEFEEKEEEPRASGNALRRQLQDDTTKPEVHEVHEAPDEHSDVYGGALSTTRPLFTTSSPPRILQRLRADRPKLYQVTPPPQENVGPARFDTSKYETTRSYEMQTKVAEEREERESTPPIVFRPSTRMPDRDYIRQTTESVFVRQPPEQILRDISSGLLVHQNMEEDGYRGVPVGRILYRPRPPIYPTTTDANVQYLTENPIAEPDPRLNPNYIRPRPYHRPLPYDAEQRGRPVLRPDDREYDYPYRNIALPPEAPNPIAPPLSRRDFQILLRRLLISQYGPQALTYPRTYLEDALYDQTPYPTYQTGYQVPGRQLIYEPHVASNRFGDRVPLRPALSRPDPGIYQSPRYPEDFQDSRYAKRVYRQKFYTQEMGDEPEGDGEEILPPPIREALLLRMLQLAIHNDRPVSMMTSSTTPSPSSPYKKGPVRSVQILADDDDKDLRKKI
ncbi:uncharacterized protein [Fopius arisanus]|uniref:Uncharacterized protein n=1 Tax=Fopius arisanus TaxID=64838 RepID=A0A9R1TGW8_9HYME|nr:PREDICTED: uncharacterized protein LOC105270130 [Fopius arisanus]